MQFTKKKKSKLHNYMNNLILSVCLVYIWSPIQSGGFQTQADHKCVKEVFRQYLFLLFLQGNMRVWGGMLKYNTPTLSAVEYYGPI